MELGRSSISTRERSANEGKPPVLCAASGRAPCYLLALLRQVLMDLGDGGCALTDRTSDALDRSRPHVTYGEQTRNARFKRAWRTAIRSLPSHSGEDESMCVE